MIHLPGFPIRVVVEDDLQLVGGARVVHQPGDEILHLREKNITCMSQVSLAPGLEA